MTEETDASQAGTVPSSFIWIVIAIVIVILLIAGHQIYDLATGSDHHPVFDIFSTLMLVGVSVVGLFLYRRNELAKETSRNQASMALDVADQTWREWSRQAIAEIDSRYDALTGLPTGRYLRERLGQEVSNAAETRTSLGICHIDIDNLGAINRRHGRETGDWLLKDVAHRLRQHLGEDAVGRLEGDEFIAILPGVTDRRAYEKAVLQLMNAASEPLAIGSEVVEATLSIGASLYPDDDSDVETLLGHADQMMYQAKQDGGSRFRLFDSSGEKELRDRRGFLRQIKAAIGNGEFRLHYQPKVDLRLRRVVGVEALVRWQHPDLGLLPPAHFLPFIEHTDLIVELGYWTLQTAMADLSSWRRAGHELTVSVNIAARHLQHAEFLDRLGALLADHARLPERSLELEVLETVAIDMESASNVMRQCQNLGVPFALDDFGTGYSSLTYFRKLPVEVLKIDKSFVQNIMQDPEDFAIVESLVDLARSFGRMLVAEGVEDVQTGILLMALGCPVVQGYAIARAMPAELIPAWIRAWPDERWSSIDGAVLSREETSLLTAKGRHRYWIDLIATRVAGEGHTEPAACVTPQRLGT